MYIYISYIYIFTCLSICIFLCNILKLIQEQINLTFLKQIICSILEYWRYNFTKHLKNFQSIL